MVTLSKTAKYVNDKINVSELVVADYITTDNMLPNRGGIVPYEEKPKATRVNAYQAEDILVSNIRPYFKKIWFADRNGGCSTDVLTFRVLDKDKVLPKFLYYVLHSDNFFDFMMSGANGTKMPRGNKKLIPNYLIPDFDLPTQQKIADILSAYDDLIENNQKQIKLLEESAQRLYKEWFVDLHFPNYENTPIIDGIPEGWEKTIINKVCCNINAGGTPSRSKKEYWNNPTVNWFKTQELQDCWLFDSIEKISETGLNNSSAKLFPENTILMAIYASPTLGRLGILSQKSSSNQAALCLMANEKIICYEWLFLKLYELRDKFNAIAKGAGQQNISGEIVKNTEIIIPEYNVNKLFKEKISSIFTKIKILQKQICYLRESRDLLLPKLMNGEIEV